MDEKFKSKNVQKEQFFVYVLCLCYILRAIRAGRCREQRYADHIQIYFRMHHFVVKFSLPQAARGHWPPNQNPADFPASSYSKTTRILEGGTIWVLGHSAEQYIVIIDWFDVNCRTKQVRCASVDGIRRFNCTLRCVHVHACHAVVVYIIYIRALSYLLALQTERTLQLLLYGFPLTIAVAACLSEPCCRCWVSSKQGSV